MDAIKNCFDWLCTACLILWIICIFGGVASTLVMLLHWAFTSNPRCFALGVAVVISGGLAIKAVHNMKLE